MLPTWTRVLGAVTLPVLLATACSGGGGDDWTGPDPAFSMSVSPSSLTLTPGSPFVAADVQGNVVAMDASGNVSVNITRTGGFEGAVTVTVEGLPAGVTASSLTIAAGATSGSLTITAGQAAVASSGSITIRGSASGLTARTASVSLTVTVPSIGLTLTPAALTIEQGQSAQTTANITRSGGFGGNVTLSSSGGHPLMAVQFNPATVGGNSSTITVGVGPGVPVGPYTVTIQGSGTGVANVNATLTVNVTQATIPAISIAASPNALTINRGASAQTTINITRTNFTGAVDFSFSGGVINIGGQFSPQSTTGNSTQMTVSIGPNVPPGTYTLTITGTGNGVPVANNDLTVTVTSASFIEVALAPSTVSIPQGGVGSTTLNITRTSYPGLVHLVKSNLPANVTVDFVPPAVNGNESAINVSVGPSVPTGTYQITIHASGLDIAEVTTILTLTVTAATGGGNVTFTFCAQSGMPLWLAHRNDNGPWTQVTDVGGVYQFQIDTRGVVAWVLPDGGGKTELYVAYGSRQELIGRGANFCVGNGGAKTINGSVANLGAAEIAQVYLGTSSASVVGAFPMPFVLNDVEDGVLDLVATRNVISGAGIAANAIVLNRDINPANNATLSPIDLASGHTLTNQTATVNFLGGDHAMASILFRTKNGTSVPLFAAAPTASSSQPWRGVPPDGTVDGDFHIQSIVATPPGVLTGFPFRSFTQFNRSASDRTYNLPDAIATLPTFTFNGSAPYVTFTSSWNIEGEYNDVWSMNLVPASGSVSAVIISGGAGYFGSFNPVQLAIETFGAGFNPAWGLQPGIMVNWYFTANGGPAWDNGFSTTPFNGAIALSAGVTGSWIP